jgi:hypothetical protein
MNPYRLQIKYFVENPSQVDLSAFTGIYQRWIQERNLEGVLIDVADYRHVHEGPGIILLGHESDYGMDEGRGQLGLLYTRKRQVDDTFQKQLHNAFRLSLTAASLLEAEPVLQSKLKFRTDNIEIRFPDRLQVPNTPESLDLVRGEVTSALAAVYGSRPVSFTPISEDKRQMFTLGVQAAGSTGVAELLQQLQLTPTN